MRNAITMVVILLCAGLVHQPQPSKLAEEITVFATDDYPPIANITLGDNQAIESNIVHDGTSPYHSKNEFMIKAYNATRVAAMQDLKKRIENIFRYHARQIKAGKI